MRLLFNIFLFLIITSSVFGFPPEKEVLEKQREMTHSKCLENLNKNKPLLEEVMNNPISEFRLEFRLDNTNWSMIGWSGRTVCSEAFVSNEGHQRIRDLSNNWHQSVSLTITGEEFLSYLGLKPQDVELLGSCSLRCWNRN